MVKYLEAKNMELTERGRELEQNPLEQEKEYKYEDKNKDEHNKFELVLSSSQTVKMQVKDKYVNVIILNIVNIKGAAAKMETWTIFL